MRCLLLLGFLAAGAAEPVNEVGLSLSKAGSGSDATFEARAAVAQMTGQLLAKQQQYAAAKLKMEQLTRQEESYSRHSELLAKRESRLEAMAKMHGGVSEKAFKAKARTREFQNKMIQGEEEVKKLNQDIQAQSKLLKTTEDQLKALRQREADYNNGARLAVMKSNKVERDLKDARIQLASQKQNLTELTESAQVEEANWDSARRLREHQEAENKAEAQLLESKQGQLGLLRQINPKDMSIAQSQLEETKLMLKEARRKSKEDAEAQAEALRREQHQTKAAHASAEAQLREAQSQLENARKEQHAAVQNAHSRIQSHSVAGEEQRTRAAEAALKPYQKKVEDAEAKLHQQEVDNKVQEQEIAKKMAALQSEAKEDKFRMQSEARRSEQQLEQMKEDAAKRLQDEKTKLSNMQKAMGELKTSNVHQKRQVAEMDSQLRRQEATLEEASLRLQTFEKKEAQEQLDYERKMYEANLQREEKAQQEVEKLQQEFHKVHTDKNERITKLSHKLQALKQGKLRGA